MGEATGADTGGVDNAGTDAFWPSGKVSGPFCPQPDRALAAINRPTEVSLMEAAATLTCCSFMQRILSAMAVDITPTPLTDSQFHELTAAILSSIEATVDQWLQDDVVDIDAHRTGGLLELSFPNASKLVLNTQPPLHELWLAARSGGYHYKHVGGRWLDTREGREFFEAVSAAASEQSGLTLRFEPPAG